MSAETTYALYRGDTFIDVGTRRELAKRHHVRADTIRWLSSATAHSRVTKSNYKTRLLAYHLEDSDDSEF